MNCQQPPERSFAPCFAGRQCRRLYPPCNHRESYNIQLLFAFGHIRLPINAWATAGKPHRSHSRLPPQTHTFFTSQQQAPFPGRCNNNDTRFCQTVSFAKTKTKKTTATTKKVPSDTYFRERENEHVNRCRRQPRTVMKPSVNRNNREKAAAVGC